MFNWFVPDFYITKYMGVFCHREILSRSRAFCPGDLVWGYLFGPDTIQTMIENMIFYIIL